MRIPELSDHLHHGWSVGVSFRTANLMNPKIHARKGPKTSVCFRPKSSVHFRKSFSAMSAGDPISQPKMAHVLPSEGEDGDDPPAD
jgi:hypothetical protein